MNLVEGKIVDIFLDGGSPKAKVRVKGAYINVPLMLLMEAKIGDWIQVQSGIAIARVETPLTEEA